MVLASMIAILPFLFEYKFWGKLASVALFGLLALARNTSKDLLRREQFSLPRLMSGIADRIFAPRFASAAPRDAAPEDSLP
jgi:hypothetical protein